MLKMRYLAGLLWPRRGLIQLVRDMACPWQDRTPRLMPLLLPSHGLTLVITCIEPNGKSSRAYVTAVLL